ncbi:MAG: hypothetical protein AB7R00_26525 [Kofleriaceae bacterium]
MRLAISMVLVGCVASSPERDGSHHGVGEDHEQEIGSDSLPDTGSTSTLSAAGSYRVSSTIDLTVEAVLPEMAADVVVTLRELSANPAHTLIQLAEDAGVPAVGTIRAALPSSLESKLEGWINGEIAKAHVGGTPVTTFAANLAALAESTLTTAELESSLEIGSGTAIHQLSAVDFSPAGVDARLELDEFPDDVITATTTSSTRDATLTIGDHQFSIGYGQYAWNAVNQALIAQYGANARDILGAAINCPAIATTIANKCVFGVCVGHKAELTELCERGLDEVVNRAYAKVAAIRFDAIRFASGIATMTDATGDAVADQLGDGVWDAEINAGQGLRHVPATFRGDR